MREIKFRAWDKKENRWLFKNKGLEALILGQTLTLEKMDNLDFSQFIGMNYDNGAEVYEGDIVKVGAHYVGDYSVPEMIGFIKYSDEYFLIEGKSECCGIWDAIHNYGLEKLGNIYENPELLEKE